MKRQWGHILPKPIGFVLSGGANLGAIQVGMLEALFQAGIYPDVVAGTSVGALNGAVVADRGLKHATTVLTTIWQALQKEDLFPGGRISQMGNFLRSWLHLYPNDDLAQLIRRSLRVAQFDELQIPLAVTVTELATQTGRVLTQGDLATALLASAALPGIYPPVTIEDKLYVDGGVTASVPLQAALNLGAKSLVVLDVGILCGPKSPPRHIAEMMLASMTSATRQRVYLEVPMIANDIPILYLPKPCSLDISMLDFNHSEELMESALELTTAFLRDAQIPLPGMMVGSPYQQLDELMNYTVA